MTTAASFFPSLQAPIHGGNAWRKPTKRCKCERKTHLSFNSTFNSLSNSPLSSVSFPINFDSTTEPVQLQPLADSVQENFTEILDSSMNLQIPMSEIHQITRGESCQRIFIQDPPWIASLFLKGLYKSVQKEVKLEVMEIEKRRYNLLRRRQIKAETEAWEKMVEEYKELEREMCEKKLAPNLPYVKTLFLGWFEPLKQAIEKEQKTQRSKKQKAAFAPHIELLSADKMAVIVMYKMMGLLMVAQQDGCVQVVQAAVQIGGAIEQEVRIQSFLEKARSKPGTKLPADTECLSKEKEVLRRRVNGLIRRRRLKEVRKLLKKEEFKAWGRDTQAKLGSRLIELLIESAFIQPPVSQSADSPPDIRPAFWHRFKPVAKTPGQNIVKNYGVIECDPIVLAGLDRTAKHMLIPYIPMLVPPKKWKGYEVEEMHFILYIYVRVPGPAVVTASKDALSLAKKYDKGGHFFLPSYVMRTHGSSRQQDAMKNISGKQMQKVFEALDMLGSTKWRVNRRVLSVVESIWAQGGNTAGLVDRKDVNS